MASYENYQMKMAAMEQAGEVMSLYQSLMGSPGCTWNEKYPVMADVEKDIQNESLYLLYDGPTLVDGRDRRIRAPDLLGPIGQASL